MEERQQSIVAQWNEMMLEAIREGGAKPTATTYQLHLVSSAMYDAWAPFADEADGHYSDLTTGLAQTEENKAEAVSFAAYAALVAFFPDAKDKFDAFMAANGYDPADASSDPGTAAGLGTLAAQNVFAARAGDGSNSENDFADTTGFVPVNSAEPGSATAPGGADFDPNHWQPLRVPTGTVTDENGVPVIDNSDPASYEDQIALTPHWGGVDSFALDESSQFRPPAPPQLGDFTPYVDGLGNQTTGDQAYRDQVTEVLNFSAELTNEEKVVAEYWADGPRTESPPGHWNQIAQDIALREGHGIDEDAKLFFAVNAAVFDAGIATWEAKYTYDYIRPQSAIRDLFFDQTIEAWAGPNKGTQEILGQEWQPYQNVTFVTPPFPEFVSGHSTFSMAAANTIADFVGSDLFYDGMTLSNYDLDGVDGKDFVGRYETSDLFFEDFGDGPPVVLQWDTLTEAAEEAGISRLYGGIHIQDGNLFGLELGRQVAEAAAPRLDALFTRGGDDRIEADAQGGLIIAGGGNDTVIGGDAEDIIESGLGNDAVTLGGGADKTVGMLADLLGDTIADFTGEDELVFKDIQFGREDVGVTAGSAILGIDGNGDGTEDGSIMLEGDFSTGDFMAVSDNGDTIVTFETFLADLSERQAVNAELVNGIVNQGFLTGDGETGFEVTLTDSGFAKFDNVLGVYEIDESGGIVDTRILFENANADKAAKAMITDVEAGHALGFFIVQDGGDWAAMLDDTDTLAFLNSTGDAADLGDGSDLRLAVNGTAADVLVFHSFDQGMNSDGVQHALSGVEPGGQALSVGFEDLTGGGDRDYEDVVFRIALIDDTAML